MLGVGGGGVGVGRARKRCGEEIRTSYAERRRDLFVEKPQNHFQVERGKIFCKITGLKGDIDNEPHSPRSCKGDNGCEVSFQSEENI